MFSQTILIGRLGKDPEMKQKDEGSDKFAVMSVATTRSWKNSKGERQESVEWDEVVLFRGLAQVAHDYYKKGYLVFVLGHANTRKWTDDKGVEHRSKQLIADAVRLLSSTAATKADQDAVAEANASVEAHPE